MLEGIDEAQLRAEIEKEIRAKLEAETELRLREEQRKAELNAAFTPAVQSANREDSWARAGAMGPRPSRDSAAGIIGEALFEQMAAGLRGTDIEDDGLGNGGS
jgi:hypothetical protein